MSKFHNNFRQFVYGVGLYILFFNPNFILLGSLTVRILFPILIVELGLNFRKYVNLIKLIWLESLAFLAIFCYSIILTIFAKGNIELFKGVLMLTLGCLLIPVFLIIINRNLTSKQIINLFIKVGIVACIISFICFLFPELNSTLRELQFSTSYNLTELSFRGFGISNGLFFYFPITLSLLLILFLEHKSSISLKLPISLLFLFSIFINARIGIFPLVIYGIVKCIKSFKLLLILFAITILVILTLYYIGIEYEDTTFGFICKWILGGVGQITNPLFGTNFETFGEHHIETLGTKMFFFPNHLDDIIWGTGINLFGRSTGLKSDMGYTIQFYYGGLIVFTFICILIGLMTYHLCIYFKKYPQAQKLVLTLFISTILISNFKGDFFFQMNGGFLFLYTCYIQITILWQHRKFCQLLQ